MKQLALIVFVVAASLCAQDLKTDDFLVRSDWMSAEGHWSKRRTTVAIDCFRRAGFCVESRAWLESGTNHVLLRTFVYDISRWSKVGIAAHYDGLVPGDLLITFDTKTVTLVTHEKAFGDESDSLAHGSTDTLKK